MKIALPSLLLCVAALAAVATARAQTAEAHKIILPDEITWGRAPASMPLEETLQSRRGACDPSVNGKGVALIV